MNGRLLALAALVAVSSAVVRRQIDESDDSDAPVWDPTIRNKFEGCLKMAKYTPDATSFCETFNECCKMQFDPNNGDKCQLIEQRCEPDEVGEGENRNPSAARCIYRNCTEMITTTTTTTEASTRALNSAVSVGIPCFSLWIVSLIY